MMNDSERLIVLNSTKLGDSSLVLHCLCRRLGRRSFIVGVRKGGSRALYLPFSVLDAEVLENRKSDLWRLRGVSAVYPLNGIRSSFDKDAICLFMSEVLWRAVQDGAAEDGLFDWCERSILTLDAMTGDFANYHLRFLMELAGVLGFSPSFEDLAPFAGEHLRQISDLLALELPSFLVYPLNGDTRSAIADALLRYLSAHLEIPLNIRSLAVLGELYR
ncbi:MAG: DNA repair protein RecO C-terminal domain-containing protein [Bacteroidales bacterium]|nr:DNA repair protein RecO C-terminal domain-containing protein [Bacteroidales bacterium]